MSRNRKQWTLSLDDDLENEINNYKNFYNLTENKQVISHLLKNSLNLKSNILNSINQICDDFKINKNELLLPIIEKHITKTLKKDGVVKDKHKKSSKAESELLEVLKNIVEENNKKTSKERKFITQSLVNNYLIMHSDKYKLKSMPVIRRVLAGLTDIDITFIKEYHQQNNLTINSNLRK